MKSTHRKKCAHENPKSKKRSASQKNGAGKKQRKSGKPSKSPTNPLRGANNPLQRLIESSPHPISKLPDNPNFFLNVLLPHNRLKCLGTSLHRCNTNLLADFPRPLSHFGLVVPAYMTSRIGTLKRPSDDGFTRRGPRTNQNTDRVRFVVFQASTLPIDDAIAAIEQLNNKVDLVMVVQTGAQSVEGWFSTRLMADADIQKFRRFAKVLGAPTSVFFNTHPYALPGGASLAGRKNRVVYWNPSAI